MDSMTFSLYLMESRRKNHKDFSDFMKRWMSGHLRRYHTLPLLQNQNLGFHHSSVANIVRFIYPECSKTLLEAALDHDVAEVRSGDVPYTAKRYKNMSQLLNELDAMYLPIPYLTDDEFKILKLADMLEFFLYTNFERSMGNTLLRNVIQNGRNYLEMTLDTFSPDIRDRSCRLIDAALSGEYFAPDAHRMDYDIQTSEAKEQ